MRPLNDRVAVKRLEAEEKSPGGIVLPDAAKEKPLCGKVLAIGTGRLLESGIRETPCVSVGDTVLFTKYSGVEMKVDGQEILIIGENDLLAKL